MTRKEFLFGTGAIAATFRTRAAEDTRDGLPAWANAQIDETVARYRKWKGKDETIAFTFLTDVHSRLTKPCAPPDFAQSLYHTLFTFAAADRAGCDFLVDAGDHDFDLVCRSHEEALARMNTVAGVYRDYTAKPVLFCLGNHDHGPSLKKAARPVSSELFGETFNGLAGRHGHTFSFGANKSWGAYDVPGKKFRAIFCNTSDEGYYGISQAQLDFVKTSLDTLPEGWTAALFGHYCVFNEIGHWKDWQNGAECVRKRDFMAALEAFVKRRPNDLVGYLCGDSHFDNELEFHGVNWTISQGYGGVGRASKPWGARTTAFDRRKTMLFELVAVKPAAGEMRLFRVGAGGEACDRTCLYFNTFK